MTAVDHLIAALVELEHESIEIEHRQSFIRSAIEAFGIDADDALLTAMQAEDELLPYVPSGRVGQPLTIPEPQWGEATGEGLVGPPTNPAKQANALAAEQVATPETAQQFDPEYGRLPGGRWDWDVVAAEIGVADVNCTRRARYLADTFDVSAATAQWMVKRCRELSLIDTERAPVNHQAARDAAAAAL